MKNTKEIQMNKIEAIEKKLQLDTELAEVNAKVTLARRNFAAHGKRVSIADLSNLESRARYLKHQSQLIQLDLAKQNEKTKIPIDSINKFFVDVARVMLDNELFYTILKEAQERASKEK